MKSSKDKANTSPADGAWTRLDDLESIAQSKISSQLGAFEKPLNLAYEAGLIVPVLRKKGQSKLDVRLAAIFFKRLLNDLRAVWVLLESGYTSQAATVASSLFENSLVVSCLTISEENIEILKNNKEGKIPWTPMQMCKMLIYHEGHTTGSTDYENQWRALYAGYVWLCQLKHSSLQSVLHDTKGSELKASEYVVMAFPNTNLSDLSLKAGIITRSLNSIHSAIDSFAEALGLDEPYPDDYGFRMKLKESKELYWKAFEPFLETPNPISIQNTWFPKKYPLINEAEQDVSRNSEKLRVSSSSN